MILTRDNGERFVYYSLGETLYEIENQVMELALENNNGCVTAAARSLGLNRSTLTMRLLSRRELAHLRRRPEQVVSLEGDE